MISLVISNIETWPFLKISFSLASALIIVRLALSCSPFFLMYSHTFLVTSVRGSGLSPMTAANVGDGSVISATAGSGDLGNGVVTAQVIGNNGTVTFTSTTVGALGNGAGDTISYGQIATAAAANTSATVLAHPTLADAATTTVTLTPASGKVINRDAKWTYTYTNAAVVAPGTYGGVNTNNSRVTYTASMP